MDIPDPEPAILYDDQDRLLKFGSKTFTYKLNGDLTSMTDSATSTISSFTYDVLGNLKQVVLPTKTINYKVDAYDRRVVKLNGTTVKNYFIWNSFNQLIGVMNSNGSLTARFVYGSKSHVPDYMMKNNINYQIVSNHLGSPVAVVNASTGAVAQEIKYDEFGAILSDTNPGFMPFGFAGCLYDLDTKLCRFGARDYDSSIGRWLSKDPILFAGGDTNLYGYVMQDPVNWIDSDGLSRDKILKDPSHDIWKSGGFGRGGNTLPPAPGATGAHSVWKSSNGKISGYKTYGLNTNPSYGNTFIETLRFNGSGHHFNKATRSYLVGPQIHDPSAPGGVRSPEACELPPGY